MFKNGFVVPFEIWSESLQKNIKLSVYLPKDYSPFIIHQLLICFDGQDFSRFGQIHRVYDRLIQSGEIEPAIILFIHYDDVDVRSTEYHPNGINKVKMMHFVNDELLTYANEHFNISLNPEHILLLGDSLAASISLELTIHYPETFTRACLFSPMIVEAHITSFNYHADYFLIVGKTENDFELITGGRANFLTPIRTFHNTLLNEKIKHYYAELDGGHTWKTWKPQIENVLKYYLY